MTAAGAGETSATAALIRDRLTWTVYLQLAIYGYFLYSFTPSVNLLRDDEGKIAGIMAVIRDASERWAADRELKLRLNEAERKLRELSGGGPADASGPTA